MADRAELDHAVINVLYDMDRAQRQFEEIGFTVTPRGYHSLGSINHLMIFGTDYLELIGLPEGIETPRPEIADSPIGLTGLVFKSPDVDATFAHLQAIDMAGAPPKAFYRPVSLPGGEQDARFRTVAVKPGIFPAGRVYFCEHGTPELVWRPEWQAHANRGRRMPEYVIVSVAPDREAERYGHLLDVTDAGGDRHQATVEIAGARLAILSPERYGERYGPLAATMDGRPSIFGAVVIETGDVSAIGDLIAGLAAPPPARIEPGRVTVRLPAFDAVLEFVE